MKPAIELGALQSRVNHLATGLAVADLSTAFQGAERLTVLKPAKGVP